MPKKVSIVVITYNAVDCLKECLQSVEEQDYKKLEIIVVNDASADGTFEFLQNYKDRTKRKMTIITNETKLGVAGARNVGIMHAIGDIIAFTDADCVADMRWISELVEGYKRDGVAAVGGGIFDKRITNIWELSEKGHDFVADKEGYVSYIQGCNMSFDSCALKKYMFNDELKYGYEEALLCDHMIDDGYKIYFRPQAVVHHKHRNTLRGLLKRKYLLGVSSIWYRQKRNKPVMFKRHIVFLLALALLPLFIVNKIFLYLSLILSFSFLLSLLRDEIIFDAKTVKEILITFPFLVIIEISHFWGSIVGLFKFRVLNKPVTN